MVVQQEHEDAREQLARQQQLAAERQLEREDLAALEKDYEEVGASSSFAGAGESGFGSDGEF